MRTFIHKEKSFFAILALLSTVILFFIGLNVYSIFKARQNYLNEVRIKAEAQAQLLAENVAGAIYAVDLTLLSLRAMIDEYQMNAGRLQSAPTIQFVEFKLKLMPQIKDILFLNQTGEIVYSSSGSERFRLAAFERHRDAWLDFSIAATTSSNNGMEIHLSRPLENNKAEFIGVLAAVLDPNYFFERYNYYLNVDVDAIALVNMNGGVLASWFNHPDYENQFSGVDIQTLPFFSSFSADSLTGGGQKILESRTAIVSTHQLPGFPFHVVVCYGKNNAMQKWRREAGRVVAIIFFTTLIAVFTVTLAFRHRQRRKMAERELLEHQARLEETVAERTTQLAETNRELTQKNAALEEALTEVKTLSGLLPICSHCKKIRDDKGYWNQIETYIHRHSGAEFSHGICPDCAKKYYPEYNLYDRDPAKT